jgi:hypothetical protein
MRRSQRPKIFLSFPGGADPFVRSWLDNKSAFRDGWDPVLYDYNVDPARVGSHQELAIAKIREADVFVAVLSSAYLQSKACLVELNTAINEYKRRDCLPFPLLTTFLMIEDKSELREWWEREREPPNGILSALPKHTVYDKAWEVARADPNHYPAAKHMQDFAAQIRAMIDAANKDDEPKAGAMTPPGVSAVAAQMQLEIEAAEKNEQFEIGTVTAVSAGGSAVAVQVASLIDAYESDEGSERGSLTLTPVGANAVAVLLGAAQRDLAAEANNALDRLEQSLRAVAPERTIRLPDRWDTAKQRADSGQNLAPLSTAPPVFVQTCDGDLGDDMLLDGNPEVLRKRLNRALPAAAADASDVGPMIIWLPPVITNPDFAARAASPVRANRPRHLFRVAEPAELAADLIKSLRITTGALELVIRDPGLSALAAVLAREFANVLGPDSVTTGFWDRSDGLWTMLQDRQARNTKLVVATHDLAGSAFDDEAAEQRLFQDGREIAKILKRWRAESKIGRPDCIAALVRQRTRGRDRGSVGTLLHDQPFRFIRIDENQADRNDVCLVVGDLGLKAMP